MTIHEATTIAEYINTRNILMSKIKDYESCDSISGTINSAEAIKEFVECLKATIDVDLSCGADSVHYLEDDLSNIMDDLAKEMVGDTE